MRPEAPKFMVPPPGEEARGAVIPGPTGVKFDGGKLPWDLLPWDVLEQVVAVLRFGAGKYAPRNWEKGINHSRTFAATQRHMVDWFQFHSRADSDTQLHPLAHAICELMFALAFDLRGNTEVDDRPTLPPPYDLGSEAGEEMVGEETVPEEPESTGDAAKISKLCDEWWDLNTSTRRGQEIKAQIADLVVLGNRPENPSGR